MMQQKKIQDDFIKKNNLFTVLDRGYNNIQKAHRKAIILMGLTRRGKSTTINWMLKKPMRGVQKKGLQPYYINEFENENDVAMVRNGFASVTLAPNVYTDFVQGVSLIDMPGYEDKRNYAEVIGFSYFLKQVFEKVKQAKFIVVITENMFYDASGESLVKTFQGFLNMFSYQKMSEELRTQLRSSMVLMVTKSRRPQDHYSQLILIQELIETMPYNTKKGLKQILAQLRGNGRIWSFQCAKADNNPKKCNFIQIMNNLQWKFFDLEQAGIFLKKSPVAPPFKEDYNRLTENQINQLASIIQFRIRSYKGFPLICEQFIRLFIQHWEHFTQSQKHKPMSSRFKVKFWSSMDSVFAKIEAYVYAYNFYEENIMNEYNVSAVKHSGDFLFLVRETRNIFDQVAAIISFDHKSFLQSMQELDKNFSVLIDYFNNFAATFRQRQLLHKLRYILRRGLKEFTVIFQVYPQYIVDANQKLRDYFKEPQYLCSSEFRKQFVVKIAKNMSEELMAKMFTKIAELEDYQNIFKEYEQKYQNQEDPIFFKEHIYYIYSFKAKLYLELGEKENALNCYFIMYSLLDQISKMVLNSYFDQAQQERELNKYSLKKLNVVGKMVKILKVLPPKANFCPVDGALQLLQHHKMVQDVKDLYQFLISSQKSPEKLLTYYQNYVNYCASWGDVDKAISLLQRKLKLQQQMQNGESYLQTLQLMKKMNNERLTQYQQFSTNLNSITKLPIQDKDTESLFKKLWDGLKS